MIQKKNGKQNKKGIAQNVMEEKRKHLQKSDFKTIFSANLSEIPHGVGKLFQQYFADV